MAPINSPRRGGKYDLLPSNTDNNPANNNRLRSKFTSKTLISGLLLISLLGFTVSYIRKSGTELNLGLDLSDRWSKLKSAGFGGESLEEMADLATVQAQELALELVSNTQLIDPIIQEKEVEDYIITKKRLFPKSRAGEVQKKLESGILSHYHWHAELQDFSGNSSDAKRLIIVGDIHGTHESLTTLLARLSYSQSSDILLHVGDLVSKSPLIDSLETVKLMKSLGIKGVRGNHDQGVIDWRNWMLAYGNTEISKFENELYTVEGEVGADKYKLPESQFTKRRGMSLISKLNEGLEGSTLAKRRGMSLISKLNEGFEAPTLAKRKGLSIVSNFNKGFRLAKRKGLSIISKLNVGYKRKGISVLSNLQKQSQQKGKYITPTKYSKVKYLPVPQTNDKLDRTALAKEGALLGTGWNWLNADFEDLAKMGVSVPEEWQLGTSSPWAGAWFEIARHMTQAEYDYLENLPLTLHLKDFNSYLVHAGMLPGEFTTYNSEAKSDSKPPLPLPPLLSSLSTKTFEPSKTDSLLFSTFERSVLLVKQNIEPFTLLNVRALLEGVVTKKKLGVAWNQIWNNAMAECSSEEGCEPVNLIYGHWKGRGLEILPNSFGLDSGCVYGQRLSALVITPTDSSTSPLDTPPTLSLEAFRASIKSTTASKSTIQEESGSFWNSDGVSSIEGLEEDGIPIAERKARRQIDLESESSTRGKVVTQDVNGQFDDLPVVINSRKVWVVSVSCPDLEVE